jgi:hypothetical protein
MQLVIGLSMTQECHQDFYINLNVHLLWQNPRYAPA